MYMRRPRIGIWAIVCWDIGGIGKTRLATFGRRSGGSIGGRWKKRAMWRAASAA
jgi:hypothetical protein